MPTGSLARGGFSPAEVAKAWRDEHPKMFDDIEDADLIAAIKDEDPDTYGLIDPLLIGAELMPTPTAGGPPTPPRLNPPSPQGNFFDTALTTGLRVVPAVAGAVGGSMIAPGMGTYLGGAAGAGLGETAAQWYEKAAGPREAFSPGTIALETAFGALNPAARGSTMLARIGSQAAFGAGLGAAGTTGRSLIERGELPTGREVGESAALGAAFGGATHAGFEGVGALARRAPGFGEATGALPTIGGPPPSPLDQIAVSRAAAAQYQVEEQRLAQQLAAVYGPEARPSRSADFHTAVQAKDYLEQLAALNRPPIAIPEIQPGLQPPGAAPLQLPAAAGPSGGERPIQAFPPGENPPIELVGSAAPPASRVIGGRDVGAVPPPPRFEEALESSLQAPPGPPRLVRPLVLSSSAAGVPRGIAEIGAAPPLLERPTPSIEGPIQQGARVGGRPATPEQPQLKGVLEPGVDRPYATGPNAGPRRKGELHGQPRVLRRQVKAGKQISYEQIPSTLPAEDPGTYPPEVRRELAAMAWELDQYRHQTYGGGLRGVGDSEKIAQLRKDKIGQWGAIAGAPVRNDILKAAEGSFAHTTRANMLKYIRAALLEGKGNGLTDAAAQVARQRLAERSAGLKTQGTHSLTTILARRGDEGDALIGWVDRTGAQALPEQDLDEFTRAARDADDGEILGALRMAQEGELNPEIQPFFAAAQEEALRRGLITLEQQALVMEGPGGAKGPSLLDFEGGPPTLSQAERNARARAEAAGEPPASQQAQWVEQGRALERRVREGVSPTGEERRGEPLPGLEAVRGEARPLSPVAEAPFALTAPPPAKPLITPRQPSLLANLLREEGVLILDVPAGDRAGLKKWLRRQEDEHGGEAWFARVEAHLDSGEYDKAWKAAASASVTSYARAYRDAKTPQQEQLLRSAIRGTPLQEDLPTQIVAGARKRAGVGTAPPVRDFPPSIRVTQAGAARGKATLGPAGILNPGTRQRPLSAAAPALRAATLDREVVRLVMEGVEEVEGLATVPGNTDTYLRLFRQVGDQIYKGQNLKLLRDAGVRIPPEELAQHWNATISDAGRTLQLMSSFAQAHREVLTEAAEAMSMGGALRGMIKGAPPVYTGARGRVATPAGQRATQEVIDQIAERTSQYQATALANDLQKRRAIGPLRALHDASYSWMLAKWNTAVRNYVSMAGRYTVDSLDHALTIPIARLAGDEPTAQLSQALLQERGLQPMGRKGTGVSPKRAWAEDLQGIYNFTTDNLNTLDPTDARKAIALLLNTPEHMAQYLGAMTGEDLQAQFSTTPVIRHLVNPKVQRFLTMFNRAQEFSARATVFDATTRALLRAKGLDPSEILGKPVGEIISAVGGQQAFDDLLFTSTAQALEATFAGRTSKDSLPGALIRFVNEAWPLKLGMPFPRFNISAAPRWIFDHSPAALFDVIRFPLDRAGITAPKGTVAGGRLYRGVRAQEIVRDELPALQSKIGQAEKAQGTALQELLGTQREFAVRQRQIARLEKRAAQPAFADLNTLEDARALQEQLGRRREQLKARVAEQKGVVTDLKSEQKKLLNRVADATGINAPNYAQFLARMTTGTVGMLGAAWVVRAQEGAQGTRWYEYRVDREGKDPVVLDFRPLAPFAQYLFVADVMNDFYQHTDWPGAHAQALPPEEGKVASPLDWSRAIWNNYEGKYTEAELGSQFAQAFLSISRAAGTTLTLTDLLTQNDWPSLDDAGRALVGTVGQFLSRFTVPGQQISDIAGHFLPEEAKVRTPPKATFEEWERPLAGPLANVPGVRQMIPERISQTTGQPVAAEYPLLRALAGIGTAPRDFVTEEVRRVGVPGQSVFIRETGDVGLDRLVAETYARILQEELPNVLEDPSYAELSTPARQRDYLQRYIFPALKRAALGETRDLLGEGRYGEAMVQGEEARRKARQEKLIADLEAGEPLIEEPEVPGTPEAPPPGPPPPPPF